MEEQKFLIKYLFGNKDKLSNQNISNGSMFVTSDSKELFFDLKDVRIKISDIIILDSNTLPENMIENKIYIKKDGSFWMLKDGIKSQVGGITQEQINNFSLKTNITISKEQPTNQQAEGDIWLIIED